MAVIQPYNDSVTPQGSLNVQANPNAFGANIGAAIQNVGTATQQVAGVMAENAEKAYQNEVANEVTAAHRLASKKQLEWELQITERANRAVPGDTSFAPTLIADISKDMGTAGGQFTSRRAQQVFAELSDRLTSSFGLKAIHIQSGLDREAVKQDFAGAIEDESKVVNGNDQNYKASLSRINAMIDDPATKYGRVDQATRNGLKTIAKRALASSSVEGYFARDIIGAAQKLLPDQVSEAYTTAPIPSGLGSKFDNVMKFIFKEEGGYNPKDGNSNAPVNFGINQKANPDVDVKNLTKEGAAQIYQTRYWNAIGGDKLPTNMAVVAMNAAINMGPEVAKTMLAQSGGDPATFTELVKQRYQAIAQNDPKQAQFLSGWLARADRALAASSVPVDAQGQPIPQLKIPKDAALAPPQGVDIPGWNDLSLDDQQKFMSKLVTDFNSRVTVDRATLADDRRNMTANFLAGNNYSGEAALQARYAAAYGPEMASRMIREDAINKDLGQFSKGIRGRSMAEITAALGAAPGDNATADEYSAYDRKLALVQADRGELQKNPVEYVAKYSTPVKQAALLAQNARADAQARGTPDAIEAAAKATQNLITASLAEQRRLGVANPTILSESEEKLLTQKVQEIAGSGQDVAQSIEALYKSYGSYGPTVAAQMAPKIGGLMNVLGSNIDPSAAALLVEANRNREQLKKTLPEDKVKGLDEAVRGVMAEYSVSLAGVPNGANVQANYQEQISLLAMARMSKLGESQNDAVQKAYKSLVGDLYTFQDGYRVPASVDAKVIRRQASVVLNGLTASDVALLPGSLGNPEDRMAAQLSSIRAYGRWVTTAQTGPDGKTQEGLTLMIPTAGGYAPIPAADGKPYFRSFGDLILSYQTSGTQTSQDALMRGDMGAYNRLRAKERAEERRLENQRAVDQARAYRAQKQGLVP